MIAFRPAFPSKLAWAKAELKTVAGAVRSEWRRDGSQVRLVVEVPDGARGVLVLSGRPDEILPPGIHERVIDGETPSRHCGIRANFGVFALLSGFENLMRKILGAA